MAYKNLYTKEQTLACMASWNAAAGIELPGRNKIVVINFPATEMFRLVRISKSTFKGTYGQTMYDILMLTAQEIEDEKVLSRCWLQPAINPKAIKLG